MFFRRPQAPRSTHVAGVQISTKAEDSSNSKDPKRPRKMGNNQPPLKRAKQDLGRTLSSTGQNTIQNYFCAKSTCDKETTVKAETDLTPHRASPNFPIAKNPSVFCANFTGELVAPRDTINSPPKAEEELSRVRTDPKQWTDDATNEDGQILNRESWSRLFCKKPSPKCEGHDEPCISLMTKKPGINRGRSFWICPRPLGPSGNKEVGTEWRCPTFIWCSDWNSG